MTIDIDQDVRLLQNSRFRRLLESRLAGQTAQNALLYALLILLVKDSGSSINSTLLVVAVTIPSIVAGAPAGTLADMLPRRFSLTAGYIARAVTAGLLFYFSGSLAYIYILVLVHSSIGQLSGPAEGAALPAIIRTDQLTAASSLMTLALLLGQIGGMVIIAPLLIKLVNPESVFIVSAVLFLVAAYIIWLTTGLNRGQEMAATKEMGFVEATRAGLRVFQRNRHAYLAIVYLVTATSLARVLVILLPKYTRDVLEISAEDTVFIAAPAAIGAGAGLLFAPVMARLIGAWRVVAAGYILLLLGMVGLGLVVVVRDLILRRLAFGIGFVEDQVGVSSVITAAMLLAIPLGFAYTLVTVGARVVVNEETPVDIQGRVFGVTQAIGDTLSLLPLLVIGVVGEVVGVRVMLLVSALAAIVVTGLLTLRRRDRPGGPSIEPAQQPGSA